MPLGPELLLEQAVRVAGSCRVLEPYSPSSLHLVFSVAAITSERDLLVLKLARGLLVDLLSDPGGVKGQLPELLLSQPPGSDERQWVRLHEGSWVKLQLLLRQLVFLYREEYIVLLSQVRSHRPAPLLLGPILLQGDDSSPVEVLVDDLRLLPQLPQLLHRSSVHLLFVIRSLLVLVLIVPASLTDERDELRDPLLHLCSVFNKCKEIREELPVIA